MIEVADKFNMVDMGGIDILKSQGVKVDGLFTRLLNSIQNCKYTLLYNWYFAEISIVPSPVELVFDGEKVLINELITVTSDDVVHVDSLEIPIYPPLRTLSVGENGVFEPPEGVYGFDKVNVNVPIPPPEYEPVEPEFYGTGHTYMALDGGYYGSTSNGQCLFIAQINSGFNYVTFLPETVSNRFRAATWPGRTYSDFEPYISQTFSSQTLIYAGGQMVTPSPELTGDDLTRRFFFTGIDGEVLIGTSNVGVLVKPILLKIRSN